MDLAEFESGTVRTESTVEARIRTQGFDLDATLKISIDTLSHQSWPDTIAKQTEVAKLPRSPVSCEMTESRLMEDIASAPGFCQPVVDKFLLKTLLFKLEIPMGAPK